MVRAETKPEFFLISAVARETGYCISHIRDLEKRGVVSPERTNTGVRLFTAEDVGRLKARRERAQKMGRA